MKNYKRKNLFNSKKVRNFTIFFLLYLCFGNVLVLLTGLINMYLCFITIGIFVISVVVLFIILFIFVNDYKIKYYINKKLYREFLNKNKNIIETFKLSKEFLKDQYYQFGNIKLEINMLGLEHFTNNENKINNIKVDYFIEKFKELLNSKIDLVNIIIFTTNLNTYTKEEINSILNELMITDIDINLIVDKAKNYVTFSSEISKFENEKEMEKLNNCKDEILLKLERF